MSRFLSAGAGLLWCASLPALHAQDAPPIAKYVPPSPNPAHVFVLDSAHVLSSAVVAWLQDSALALQHETGADIAWVTLPTLGGRPIEEAAVFLGRTWKIGSAGAPGDALRNRGLLVLYVPDKTKTAGSNFRVEVGQGLEGTIIDSRSRSISAAMRDDLRARRYDAAYLAGWNVAAALVREDYASAGEPAGDPPAVAAQKRIVALQPGSHRGLITVVLAILFGLVLVIVFIALIVASRRRGDDPPSTNFWRGNPDDDDVLRRGSSSDSSSWSSSSGSDSGSSSSDGGSFGGGGGFDGGGSSDSI